MRDDYLRATVITNVLLGLLYFAMRFGFGFVFVDNIAGLLAAIATWSLPVILSGQQRIRLRYRHVFWNGSCFGAVVMAITIAFVIPGGNSHGAKNVLAYVILTLPAIAINLLLERILFTAEERLEINKTRQSRYRDVSHDTEQIP
jgi:hypothetical protein